MTGPAGCTQLISPTVVALPGGDGRSERVSRGGPVHRSDQRRGLLSLPT